MQDESGVAIASTAALSRHPSLADTQTGRIQLSRNPSINLSQFGGGVLSAASSFNNRYSARDKGKGRAQSSRVTEVCHAGRRRYGGAHRGFTG